MFDLGSRHSLTAIALLMAGIIAGCAGEPSESGHSRLADRTPEDPPTAERGADEYAAHCARCHGADGTGTVVYEGSIQQAGGIVSLVQKGHGGLASLPIFTDNLLESIELHLATLDGSEMVTSAARAEKLYERNCIACHGPKGLGGSLAPKRIQGHPEIAPVVRNGQGAMPPITESQLSDEDLALIQQYLDSVR